MNTKRDIDSYSFKYRYKPEVEGTMILSYSLWNNVKTFIEEEYKYELDKVENMKEKEKDPYGHYEKRLRYLERLLQQIQAI